MNISDLPLLVIGVTIFLLVISIVLQFSAPLIVLAALVGDFAATNSAGMLPMLNIGGQNATSLFVFFAPIVLIMTLTRKRHGHPAPLNIIGGVVALPVVGFLLAHHSVDVSQSVSASIVSEFSQYVNMYIAAASFVALVLVGITRKHRHRVTHHK